MRDTVIRLTTQPDLWLVALALAICFPTCLAAVGMFHRARVSSLRHRMVWTIVAGLATACGLWAAGFVALLAVGPDVPAALSLGWMTLALAVCIAGFVAGVAGTLAVPLRWRGVVGGVLFGLGLAAMHHVALQALPGRIVADPGALALAFAFCAALAVCALAVALERPDRSGATLAAVLLTAAVAGEQATTMSGVTLITQTLPGAHLAGLTPRLVGVTVAVPVVIMLTLVLGGIYVDRRLEMRLLAHNRKLDAALNNMSQGLCMFDAEARLVVSNQRYRDIYGLSLRDASPGASLHDLLMARQASGTFTADPVTYCRGVTAAMSEGRATRSSVELADGRVIDLVNQPTGDGGWVATHEDITERRRAERERDRTRSFLDAVIDNIPVTVVVKDAREHRYVLVNRAGEQLYGVDRTTMLGKSVTEVLPQRDADEIIRHDDEAVQSGSSIFVDAHPLHTPHRGMRLVTAKRIAIYGENGDAQYVVGVVEDVTERKQAEAKIAHMAHHDGLTGLPNRAAFLQTLDQTLARAADTAQSIAVLCIDLERYKEINDAAGQAIGDKLLREVSRRFEAAAQGAFVARVGGDEFNVISTEGPQPAIAEALAGRLMAALDGDIEIDGHRLRVDLSMGVAVFPTDSADATTLLAHADAALAQAKTEARGSIRFFEPGMDEQLRERRILMQDLRGAIDRRELELYYQPQARLDGSVVGFEALVRWHHPLRGMVSPGMFIPIAEESGLIAPIGEWILREACREAASWPKPLRIAVNLSPIQFQRGDLPALVHTVLLETGLAAERLELEITEGVLIGDYARAVSILRRLKTLGVRIAMDDFGTGYSSLSYLQAFPIDTLKIDRSFVANLDRAPQSAAIIRAMIGLGRGLALPVVAEGVETREQLDFLAREGCTEVQGYLIGRPGPISEYARQVGRRGRMPHLKAVS